MLWERSLRGYLRETFFVFSSWTKCDVWSVVLCYSVYMRSIDELQSVYFHEEEGLLLLSASQAMKGVVWNVCAKRQKAFCMLLVLRGGPTWSTLRLSACAPLKWTSILFVVVRWICLSLHAVPSLSLCDVGSVLFCCRFSTLSVCEKQSQACRVTQMEIFVCFEQSIQWNAKCEMSAINGRSLCTFVSLQYTFSKWGMRHACYFVSACHASFRLEVRTRQCWRRNFSVFMDTCRLLPSEAFWNLLNKNIKSKLLEPEIHS